MTHYSEHDRSFPESFAMTEHIHYVPKPVGTTVPGPLTEKCRDCEQREARIKELESALRELVEHISKHQITRGVGTGSHHLPKWSTDELLYLARRVLGEQPND